jgi:hypothetical protein
MSTRYEKAFYVTVAGVGLCAFCYQWGVSIFNSPSPCILSTGIEGCSAKARIAASVFHNSLVYSSIYLYLSALILLVGLFMFVPYVGLRVLRLTLWIVAIADLMGNVLWTQGVQAPIPRIFEAMPIIIAILACLVGISELAVRLSSGLPAKRFWRRTSTDRSSPPVATATD